MPSGSRQPEYQIDPVEAHVMAMAAGHIQAAIRASATATAIANLQLAPPGAQDDPEEFADSQQPPRARRRLI